MLMFEQSAPRPGARLAILTDAFTPARFDFDLAYHAMALAADARRLGWSSDIVVPGFGQTQLYTMSETLAALSFLGIGFRPIQAEGCRQACAAAVARWLGAETYTAVVALDPALAVYAAEGLRSGPGFRRPHIAAVLWRPEVGSLAAQGRFLEDAGPHLCDALAVRALEAADSRAAIGRIAAADLTRRGLAADVLDPRDSVARLALALAPAPSLEPAGAAGRVVILGNLDARSGLEIVLDALATNAPSRPDVFLIGQMGDMATGHAGAEIARFAARYGGRWGIDPTIDTVRIVRAVKAGDLVASYDDGSANVGEVLAAAVGASSCGRLHEGGSALEAALGAPDVRAYRGLLRRCLERPMPPMPLPKDGATEILSRLLPVPGASPGAVRSRPGASVEVVMIGGSASSQDPDVDLRVLAERIGPHFTATVIAPADGSLSASRVTRHDPAAGLVPALDAALRASEADRVLVLPPGALPAEDAAGDWSRLLAGLDGDEACLFPLRHADGGLLRPLLTAPALLTQTGPLAFPILLSPGSYRRHVPILRATTAVAALREIQLRLLIGEGRLRDVPEPVFVTEARPGAPRAFVYPLTAYDDARVLAMAAAEAVGGQDADAIRLYQEQALCALQNSAAGPWSLEQEVPGMFARVRGIPLSSPSGGRPKDDAEASGPDLGRLLGRLGRSEMLLGPSAPVAGPAGSVEAPSRPAGFDGRRKESFAAWVVRQGRVSSAHQIAQSVRSALEGLPDWERDEMLALARHVLQTSGRQDVSGHLW